MTLIHFWSLWAIVMCNDTAMGHAHGATYGNWVHHPEPRIGPLEWAVRAPFILVGSIVAFGVYIITFGFCCEHCSAEEPEK